MAKANTIRIDFGPLEHFLKEFKRHEFKVGGPMDTALKQIGTRYLTAMAKRYDKASRSPGKPWKALAASTQKSRRKARRTARTKTRRKTRVFAILKDTGLVRSGLNIGQPGNVFRRATKAIYVGYGGAGKHKDLGGSGGRATIADIAIFHQLGMGRLPKREILVSPPPATTGAMIKDVQRGLDRLARQSSHKKNPRRI